MCTQVTRPDRGNDRQAAHRRRALFALVTFRGLVANRLAQPPPREHLDQHRSQQKRNRQRQARGDQYLPHRPMPSRGAQTDRQQLANTEPETPTGPVWRTRASPHRNPFRPAPRTSLQSIEGAEGVACVSERSG